MLKTRDPNIFHPNNPKSGSLGAPVLWFASGYPRRNPKILCEIPKAILGISLKAGALSQMQNIDPSCARVVARTNSSGADSSRNSSARNDILVRIRIYEHLFDLPPIGPHSDEEVRSRLRSSRAWPTYRGVRSVPNNPGVGLLG